MIKCENCTNYFNEVCCYIYGVPCDDAECCSDWIYADDKDD